MMQMIQENLQHIKEQLPKHVTLVAVSKFHPKERLMEAYNAGQRIFGESHEREMTDKYESLPDDIKWHFIGHLQTNKVKYIAPYVAMIEAVDSIRLLREIEKQAARHNRVIPVLLELHIAQEATKYGLTLDDCRALLSDGEWRTMSHVSIQGLMMMASFTNNQEQIRREFLTALSFFDEVKRDYFAGDDNFCIRSWGMSDDFLIAVECGSTMVRVGTSIFGQREY
ncbi:MAG: YggS family pyridoxal phosphate-dependent enzyme [Prevotella sp.]|nr:YggS family pyridoxal phosphate-dependent enzyme [Prevotella sp.]